MLVETKFIENENGNTIKVFQNVRDEITIEISESGCSQFHSGLISLQLEDAEILLELLQEEISALRNYVGYSKSEREDILSKEIVRTVKR